MKSIPDSKQLSDMAHKEWKNREEHRGIHDESDWCSGWISGYLSANIPSRGFKIVESVPDKNNILIIAIKEDPYGTFISREAALKYIVKENQLKDLHEHVEALCDEIVEYKPFYIAKYERQQKENKCRKIIKFLDEKKLSELAEDTLNEYHNILTQFERPISLTSGVVGAEAPRNTSNQNGDEPE